MAYATGANPSMAAAPPPQTSGWGSMNPWEKGGVAAAGGAGLLGIGSMLGGDDSGFDTSGASGYLSQIPDILKKYFEPYQEMLDPTSKIKELGAGYKESPGYQFELGQALKAGGQASAAGGMAGSPMQQQQAQQTAQGFASQDYYKYLQNALNMYQTGAQGYRGLGEDLSSNLMSQAQLQQLQQEEQAKQAEQKHSDIWGTIGSVAGAAAMIPW